MNDDAEARKRLQEQLDGRAQRHYSQGRIRPDDDGDLAFAVGHDPAKRIVVIDYGRPVAWVGMPAGHAVKLAEAILQHALEVADGPLSITIGGTIQNLRRKR